MPSNVKVGIHISAVDNTRRAVSSVRRNFSQMQRQFASVNKLGNVGNMGAQFRRVRREVMATAGVTRSFVGATGTGAELIANRALPKLQKSLKQTAKVNASATRSFADNWNSIGGVFSNAYITAFILFRAIQAVSSYMVRATIDNEKYIKTLNVLEGSMEKAHRRMEQMHEIARLPSIQVPEAAQSFIKLSSVGLTSTFSIQIIEEFSNAMAIAGGTSKDLSESIRQLGQMLSTGKIDMENYRVILERMPTIRTAIQKTFGPGAVHTDVLQEVLNKEQLNAEEAWQKIFDVMQYEKRADPNTLSNRLESFQDAFWELSTVLGDLWAPDFKNAIGGLTKIIDAFNKMNKPLRDFIGWMGSAVAIISGLGIALFAISKMFKVIREPYGRVLGFFRGFGDRDIHKEGGRAEKRYGATPTLKYSDLHKRRETKSLGKTYSHFADSMRQRKENRIAKRSGKQFITTDPSLFPQDTQKQEMQDYADKTEQDFVSRKEELERRKGKFKGAYAENEKLMREEVDRELLNSTKMEQEMTRKAEARAQYNDRMENIATKIQTEQTKMARHAKNLTKSELELTDKYNKEFLGWQKNIKEVDRQLKLSGGEPLGKGQQRYLLGLSKEIDESQSRMTRILNKIKSPLGSTGEIYKLQRQLTDVQSNQMRVFQETGNRLFKKEAKKHLAKYKKQQVASLIDAAKTELGDDVSTDQIKKMYGSDIAKIEGMTTADLPKQYKDTIRQRVKPELDSAMKEINDVVKQTQADLNSALDKGNMGRLKSLHTELDNTMSGFDEFEREYVDATAEMDRKIAEDNVKRASEFDEQGKRIFHDPDTEDKIVKGQRKFAQQWSDNTRHLKKQVAETDGLRKRAWANFKSIDHMDNLVEMAYGAGIGIAIAGIAFAVTALITHFKDLKTATEEYAELIKKELPNFIEFRDLYLDWGANTKQILKTGVEPIGAEMARAFEKEQAYLRELKKEKPDVFFEFQEKRLRHINRLLNSKGFQLDEYRRKYWELEQERQLKLLADPRFQSKGVEDFEKTLPGLRQELHKLDRQFAINGKRISELFPKEALDAIGRLVKEQGNLVVSADKWYETPSVFIANELKRAEHSAKLLQKIHELIDYDSGLTSQYFSGEDVRIYSELRNTIKSLEFDFEGFRKSIEAVNEAFAKAKDAIKALNIEFKDIGDWSFRSSGVEGRIEEIRQTFFHHHVEMQKLISTEKSHLEQIVGLEESANDKLEKANEKRQKIYNKFQLHRWIEKNRQEISEIIGKAGGRSGEISILDVIGDIDKGGVTKDHKQLIETAGQKSMKSLLKEVNKISIALAFDELAKVSEDAQDEANKTVKKIADSHRDFLTRMRESFQTILLHDEKMTPIFKVGQLTRYLATLKEIRDVTTDENLRERFSESIIRIESNLKDATTQGNIWTKTIDLIRKQQAKVGDTAHITGFSPDRLRDAETSINRQQIQEARTLGTLLDGLKYTADVNPFFDADKLNASQNVLQQIADVTAHIAENSGKWAKQASEVDGTVSKLQESFYLRPEGIQKVVGDEIGFLKDLKDTLPDDIDIRDVQKKFDDMSELSSHINNYTNEMARFGDAEGVSRQIEKFKVVLEKQSQLLTDYDRNILQENLNSLEDIVENYKKIPDWQKQLRDIQDELSKFLKSSDVMEATHQFLTGVRTSITEANDLPARIHKAQQELAILQAQTDEPGKLARRAQDIFNAKEELRLLNEQVDARQHAKGVFETYIGLFPKQLQWMRFTREELEKVNQENSKMIGFYNEIRSLRIQDSVQNIFKGMFGSKQDLPKVSKFLEKVRAVGRSELNLSRTDLDDYPSRETVDRDIDKALKDLEWQSGKAKRFYRDDSAGRDWFRTELVKGLQTEGLMPTDKQIDEVIKQFDEARKKEYDEVNLAVSQRRDEILRNRDIFIQNAIRSQARKYMVDFLKDTTLKPIDFSFQEAWTEYVDKPVQYKRQIEDIKESTAEAIKKVQMSTRAGVRAGHADEVLSARQRRKKMLEIRRDEAKQIEDIAKKQAKANERLWEDRIRSMKKYFAEFAKEYAKKRYLEPLLEQGFEFIEKGLDAIGLDALIPTQDSGLPVGQQEQSWWNQSKDHLERGMENIVDSFGKELAKAERDAKAVAKAHDYAAKAANYLAEAAKYAAQQLLNCKCPSDENLLESSQPKGPGIGEQALDGLGNALSFEVDPGVVNDWLANAAGEMFGSGFSVSTGTGGERSGTVTIGKMEYFDPETGEKVGEVEVPIEATHDHPYNDRRMRQMGWQQAGEQNKRLGFRSAQHMREYFEAGFEERVKGYESQRTDTGGREPNNAAVGELKNIKNAIIELQEITSEVASRPVQVNISDNQTRKINHTDEKMTRQHRTRNRRRNG